ncbi:MAG: zinc metallopeptidase [Planctomycetota bacterium]
MWNDPLYWLVLGVGALLSFWAAARVKGTAAHFSQVRTRRGLTGADVARVILRANGIDGVTVEPVPGQLTDHYDPRSKTLRLSETVYGSDSITAVGVAAHEVGHAIQDARGYAPLKFRSAWVPLAGLGSQLGIWVVVLALFMGGVKGAPVMSLVGLALFAASTVFTLITLPVEFDASRRALVTLEQGGVLLGDEMPGARKVLNAAALTYVAAFASSLLMLLYWAMRLGLFGGRNEE